MKRLVYIAILLLSQVTWTIAQDFKQAYNDVLVEFEQRLPNARNSLKEYLNKYPYTPYEDEILTMQGVLYTEKGKYKNAIKTFSKVRVKNLSRTTEPMYYFHISIRFSPKWYPSYCFFKKSFISSSEYLYFSAKVLIGSLK